MQERKMNFIILPPTFTVFIYLFTQAAGLQSIFSKMAEPTQTAIVPTAAAAVGGNVLQIIAAVLCCY